MTIDSPLKPLAVLALALAAIGPLAAATAEEPPARDTPPTDLETSLLEEQRNTERRVVGLSRFRLSFPQRLSGAVGTMWVRQPASYECHSVCELKGPFVQAEPGLSGGQLSVGYGVTMAEKGANKRFVSRTYMGYGVRAALLRTWNDADLTPSDQTLFGVEGDFSIININFSVGVFRHVGGEDPEDRWIVGGGVGWGF